ncbi:MAG: (5-formylfuran-3-yl)methyl phosphate synthase [Deltaproteobacteria bacterium]|nr:(5-formylfuran-3-yl)methyl phosphate synthase [Deltaproteobacteria bacterium]
MKLLISIVNEQEAIAAIKGGADIIDVKNPLEGALGANFPGIIKGIRDVTPINIPVSAAIGDAPDLPGLMSLAALGAATCNIQYVKVGLYGVRTTERATKMLMEIKKAVKGYKQDIKIIAVAYGDGYKINALSPHEALIAAAEAGVDGCMMDTIIKGEGDLFSSISVGNINKFLKICRSHNLISALAGSLKVEHLPLLKELRPGIIGFRGAVCRGDRVNGVLDSEEVRAIKIRL